MKSATSALLTPRCRICYETSMDDSKQGPLIRPCNCSGSVALVHEGCLNRWLESRADPSCELCQTSFEVISCGFKSFSHMTWPHALGDDLESRLEFFFLGFWLLDTIFIFAKMMLYGGQAFQLHMVAKFGYGWLLYFGTMCTVINFFYYGAVFMLVIDQWLWENTIFVLRDRNTATEREKIMARIRRNKTQSTFVTCKEENPPPMIEKQQILIQ